MTQHNIMFKQPTIVEDMERLQMTGDAFGPKADAPLPDLRSGRSVFRPGRTLDRLPVTLDHVTGRDLSPAPLDIAQPNPDRVWESLTPITLDPEFLAGNGLFPLANQSPTTATFDILRTRTLQALEDRNWRRIAVTSPTHGCGKSLIAANLALSLSRRPSTRSVLMDLELRQPALAGMLGVANPGPLRDFLTGEQPLESHFRVANRNLALALNGTPVPDAAELLQEPATTAALSAMVEHLAPDIVIYDLPHALGSDDVIAMLPQLDAILLVADGTRTTAADIRACERLFEGRVPLLGVVLNRAQDRNRARYRYAKG
jgi:Mrp family chromosome partitioning ATPase